VIKQAGLMSFASPPRPYPPDRFHGDAGEVSAVWRPHDTEPELVNRTGSADYLATGTSTNGDYGLYRWNMGPDPSGPDPHFHKALSESFFVISGTIRLYDGRDWVDGRPGDFLYVPEGGLHAFRNESGEPASMLILFAPGAPRERYFEGLAELATMAERPGPEEMAEFFLEHDTFWV
jgi:mannose-6-phosphate isomerase-like protein (cupin superfamily)